MQSMQTHHPHCVTLVCNQGFLKPALFVANQLLHQTGRNFDIVICSGEDLRAQIPGDFLFVQVETEDFTRTLPTNARLGPYAYWRIPALESLANHYAKILYLDADIFINTALLGDIFEIDLTGFVLAAVRDVHQITKPRRMPQENKILGLPWTPYFNSGVLLVNAREWISQQCYTVIKQLSLEKPHALVCHDQSLLNLMTRGQWLEMSPVWNWQYSYRNCFLTEYVSPRLIHVAGKNKLWHEPDGGIPRRYWETYQVLTHGKAFAGTNGFPVWSEALTQQLWKRLLKNLWYFKAYKKYLLNFPEINSIIKHDGL